MALRMVHDHHHYHHYHHHHHHEHDSPEDEHQGHVGGVDRLEVVGVHGVPPAEVQQPAVAVHLAAAVAVTVCQPDPELPIRVLQYLASSCLKKSYHT